MTRAALGLGANLGDPTLALATAVHDLCADDEVSLVAVSSLYRTAPVGGPEQPDYTNAVLIIETSLEPAELLALAHRVEQGAGRTREVRWGPRTLDIDVLAFGDWVSDDPALTIPHPRAHQRAFVLVPWCEVDPDFEVPGRGTPAELVGRVAVSDVHVIPGGAAWVRTD